MGKLNMKGATPVGETPLCGTCTNAFVITGFRESELVMICTEVHPNLRLPFPVYECTGYYDKNKPSYLQMEKLAIKVEDRPLKKAGFRTGLGFAETAVRIALEEEDMDEGLDD